jgi:hypothetical protein
MPEKPDINDIEAVCFDSKTSRLGLVSLVFAVVAILFFYTSIHRIAALHNNVCLVRETPFYNTVNMLCSILPATSVTFAILSLMRCRRNKTSFTAAIPALADLLLAFASFMAYFLILLALAHSQS